jgi:hypothetical protein
MHSALAAMAAYRQFIVYRTVSSASRPGKTDKFPCDYRTGEVISAHDSNHWTDAATAEATAASWGAGWGVGFVFTASDPFFFVDIDNCLTPEGWSPLALQLCQLFAGAAIEVSQSGTGLHIFGTGNPPAHGCRNQALGLEFYDAGRFVALTGVGAVGDAGADMSNVLAPFVAAYMPADAGALGADEDEWNEGPCAEWYGPSEDGELIRRAMMSQSAAGAFGGKACFADLWLCNVPVLANTYPDSGGRSYGASEADAALAQHLAFWTGKDHARIERIMRMSGLARDKWDDRGDYYLPRTIRRAVVRQEEVLQDERPVAPPPAPDGTVSDYGPLSLTSDGYLTLEQQAQHFAGCVYVSSQNRALIPGGALIKPDAFRVRYGGFTFRLDNANSKTTRDAWEAWTQSQVTQCPQAQGLCFRPALGERELVFSNGQTFVNTYIPLSIPRAAGDPGPFLLHLAKILPNERDRTILLSYMAACVQHQGIKFQWAPLLQGVEGNGKTFFARCIEQAVGARYTHWVTASKLSSTFNAWLVGKVFYAVEDIYVPDAKREIFEDLKPMITNNTIEIEAKGIDQFISEICGNFLFNSNHLDAIRKTENDRRICTLFCAQQQAPDIARDGMSGDYFPDLYKWLRDDGYAIVNELLYSYPIPAEFNPAGDCHRAPVTSTTHIAISESLGAIEQEVVEAVEQGLPGFAGGWISSLKLDQLLRERNMALKLPPIKRKRMLEQMGYILHPALIGGRVNNMVTPDNGKPRLYVKRDSLASQITEPTATAKAYEQANANGNGSPVGLPFAILSRG